MSTVDTEELNSAQMLSHPSPLTNSHSINPAAYQPTQGPGPQHMPPQPIHNNFQMPPNAMRNPNYRPLPPHLLNPRSRTPYQPQHQIPPHNNSVYSQVPPLPSPVSQPNSEMNMYPPPPPVPSMDLTPSQNVLINQTTEADNVRKVERFLLMLISLAKQKGRPTHMLMQCLVQNLLLDYISEEDFMRHLEQEMDCPPQDKLLTLLKRNMPSVRQNFFDQNPGNQNLLGKKKDVMLDQQRQLVDEHRRAKYEHAQHNTEFQIAGPGDNDSTLKQPNPLLEGLKGSKPFLNKLTRPPTGPPQNGLHTGDKSDSLPIPSPSQRSQSPSSARKQKPVSGRKPDGTRKKLALSQDAAHSPAEGEVIEDEDDSDITVMANIDLNHERLQMAPTQTIGDDVASIQDRTFLPLSELFRTVNSRALSYGIDTIEKEACMLISHALEERVRNVLESLSEVTSHRNLNLQDSEDYEVTGDVKDQLRAIERVDQSAVDSKLDREKKMLIKVSRQRMSKSDDPEVNKMKEMCKKLKKEEEESVRKMAADVTALKMTGQRKKWSSAGPNPAPSSTGASRIETERGARSRTRQVRITMKDFGFYLSQERDKKKSIEYYKALLK